MAKTTAKKTRGRSVGGAHLVVRKDGVLCTVCFEIEPVHPGESGTPLPSLLVGYDGVMKRHPPSKHEASDAWKYNYKDR